MPSDLCFFHVGSDLPRGSHEKTGAEKATRKQSSVTGVLFPYEMVPHDTQIPGSELIPNSLQLGPVLGPQATLFSNNTIQYSIYMVSTPALALLPYPIASEAHEDYWALTLQSYPSSFASSLQLIRGRLIWNGTPQSRVRPTRIWSRPVLIHFGSEILCILCPMDHLSICVSFSYRVSTYPRYIIGARASRGHVPP